MPCARLANGRRPLSAASADLNQVAHTAPCDQPTEPLQEFVTGGESLVVVEDVVQRVAFIRFQFVRWPQAQPAHVDPLHAWTRTRSAPGHVEPGRALLV